MWLAWNYLATSVSCTHPEGCSTSKRFACHVKGVFGTSVLNLDPFVTGRSVLSCATVERENASEYARRLIAWVAISCSCLILVFVAWRDLFAVLVFRDDTSCRVPSQARSSVSSLLRGEGRGIIDVVGFLLL